LEATFTVSVPTTGDHFVWMELLQFLSPLRQITLFGWNFCSFCPHYGSSLCLDGTFAVSVPTTADHFVWILVLQFLSPLRDTTLFGWNFYSFCPHYGTSLCLDGTFTVSVPTTGHHFVWMELLQFLSPLRQITLFGWNFCSFCPHCGRSLCLDGTFAVSVPTTGDHFVWILVLQFLSPLRHRFRNSLCSLCFVTRHCGSFILLKRSIPSASFLCSWTLEVSVISRYLFPFIVAAFMSAFSKMYASIIPLVRIPHQTVNQLWMRRPFVSLCGFPCDPHIHFDIVYSKF
jgi:hypothetical protein